MVDCVATENQGAGFHYDAPLSIATATGDDKNKVAAKAVLDSLKVAPHLLEARPVLE